MMGIKRAKRKSSRYQQYNKTEREREQKYWNREKHSVLRSKQRYNQYLTRVDEEKIISKIIVGDCLYVRTDLNSGGEFYYVKHNNIPMKVLYNPTYRTLQNPTKSLVTDYEFNADEYNKLVELEKQKQIEENKKKESENKMGTQSTQKKVQRTSKKRGAGKDVIGHKWAYTNASTEKVIKNLSDTMDKEKVGSVPKEDNLIGSLKKEIETRQEIIDIINNGRSLESLLKAVESAINAKNTKIAELTKSLEEGSATLSKLIIENKNLKAVYEETSSTNEKLLCKNIELLNSNKELQTKIEELELELSSPNSLLDKVKSFFNTLDNYRIK